MKRRILVLLLAILFTLTGCKQPDSNPAPSKPGQESIIKEDTQLIPDSLYKMTYQVPDGVNSVLETEEFEDGIPTTLTVNYYYGNGAMLSVSFVNFNFLENTDVSNLKTYEADGVKIYIIEEKQTENAVCYLDGYSYALSMVRGTGELEELIKTIGFDKSAELPVLKVEHDEITYTLPDESTVTKYEIENEYVGNKRKQTGNYVYYTYGEAGKSDYKELSILKHLTDKYKNVQGETIYDNVEINGVYFRANPVKEYYPEYLIKTKNYVYQLQAFKDFNHALRLSDYEKTSFDAFMQTVSVAN